MSKSGREEMESMKLVLDEFANLVDDLDVRKQALEDMADPVVEEAKRMASRPRGRIIKVTGRLAETIRTQWDILDPDTITIGFGPAGFYGGFWERGFTHVGKKRTFMKEPVLRPALNKTKQKSAEAGIKTLRRYFERIN